VSRKSVYLAIFVFVLAPVAAIVIISALLLFGVPPQTVFVAGRAVQSAIGGPNRIAVASTAFMVWLIVVAIGMVWEFLLRR
jgi:hypothetical protein